MPKFVAALDLVKNELLNARIQNLASDPSSPVEGQIYYNSTDKTLRFYNGTSWDVLGRLDQTSAPTADVALNSRKITGLATPVSGTDAANKDYVDNLSAGIAWKDSVRAATAVAGTLATSFENGDAIDGVTLATGDRILVKNQAAGAENGIYIVASSGAPTRAGDANTGAEIVGAAVFVEEGSTNADTAWVLSTNAPITLESTTLTFAKFASTAASLARFAQDVGDGSATQIDVTHSLGTKDVHIHLYRVASPYDEVVADIEHLSTTVTRLRFASAPASAEYRCVVLG